MAAGGAGVELERKAVIEDGDSLEQLAEPAFGYFKEER